MTDDSTDETAAEAIADRLRYAPDLVDFDQVIEVLAAADPEGRETIAAAIGSMPAGEAGKLSDAVPYLVETLEGATDQERRNFLWALARIAETDPTAVRPALDQLVDGLTAFNVWVNRAATEAFRHVVSEHPAELDRIEPLFDHPKQRMQSRAASVIKTVSEQDPTLALDFLDDCVELVARDTLARDTAVEVLANAGWINPSSLDPAIDGLIATVRETGSDRATHRKNPPTDEPERDESDDRRTDDGESSDQRTGGPPDGGSTGGRPSDRVTGSRPGEDRPSENRPSENRPSENRPSEGGPSAGVGRPPGGDAVFDAEDEAETCRSALVALGHVAGNDPGTVTSIVPICVELAMDEHDGISEAASRLLVTLVLQESSASANVSDLVGSASYFDRRTLIEGIAGVSSGLPGREILGPNFFDDGSRFIRFEAYRQFTSVET